MNSWFQQPCVRIIAPTENHWPIFKQPHRDSDANGNLAAEAHLAALALEHGSTLYSTDHDFARFPALRWVNLLAT